MERIFFIADTHFLLLNGHKLLFQSSNHDHHEQLRPRPWKWTTGGIVESIAPPSIPLETVMTLLRS